MPKLLIAFLVVSVLSSGQNSGTNANKLTLADGAPPGFTGLSAPENQGEFAAVVADGHHAVSWKNGYLLSFGDGSWPISLYDRTGRWLFETPLRFEGAARIFVQDAVPSNAGTAVVAASAVNNDGATADLIAEVGSEGVRRIIRTSPFYPVRLCVVDDLTVWAYGKELNKDRNGEPRLHYAMLREYSFDKGQSRSEVDRSSVHASKGVPVHGSTRPDVQMRCNSRAVMVLSIASNELLEYDLAKSKLNRWSLAPLPDGFHLTGAALTDSGEIYVSALQGAARPKAQTAIFQVSIGSSGSAVWVPVTSGPAEDKWYVLLGSDGESLVYSRGLRAPTVFWSKAQKAGTK